MRTDKDMTFLHNMTDLIDEGVYIGLFVAVQADGSITSMRILNDERIKNEKIAAVYSAALMGALVVCEDDVAALFTKSKVCE